jgi:AICAR transformylase/IMP cyclohydrolase PurH
MFKINSVEVFVTAKKDISENSLRDLVLNHKIIKYLTSNGCLIDNIDFDDYLGGGEAQFIVTLSSGEQNENKK